ncbi:hypothetical protein, partial [Thauera terpenica]|uniref:hypothetical protein n=1 Tax=Thauera terpenica TaxID=76113 RepID=UPI001C3F312E
FARAAMLDLKPSGSPAPPGWMTFYCTNATQMRNHSTTFTAQVGSSMYSANSGQQLAKFLIGAGVGAMVLPFVGPVGAFMVGQAASYGAGGLMSSVGGGG